MTAIGVFAATVAFAIVGRFSQRPARTYTIVAVVALLLSLIPNIAMLFNPAAAPFPGGNPGSISVLILQHIVAAVVAISVLTTRGITRS